MFGIDFYPTPDSVIDRMLSEIDVSGKSVLEPSAGKGNIADRLRSAGANVSCCEIDPHLRKVLMDHHMIGTDFLELKSDQTSHFDFIVMNPPFSSGAAHLLHAWNISPSTCEIKCLLNSNTVGSSKGMYRELNALISNYGNIEEMGQVFIDSERSTGVDICMITLKKPGTSNNWDGYFETENSDTGSGAEGLQTHNDIREIVQRYTGAVDQYDVVAEAARKLNSFSYPFGSLSINFRGVKGKDESNMTKETFAKELQKSAWRYVFSIMNMRKYVTRGLMEDLNKFVEQQTKIPFTMKNIYTVIDTVIQTHGERMDQAAEKIFDDITYRHSENRHGVEGWKTNKQYLLGKKFIKPYCCKFSYGKMDYNYSSSEELEDFQKVLCYITGQSIDDHQNFMSLFRQTISDEDHYRNSEDFRNRSIRSYEDATAKMGKLKVTLEESIENSIKTAASGGYRVENILIMSNKWYKWSFFEVKMYKKGTVHFKFKDEKVWELFNRKIGEIKGLTLPEKI